MSTANKFKRAKKTKLGLKDTINTYLGQNITDAIPFKDYETYIKNFYNSLPKTEYAEGRNITLSNTLKGKLDFEKIYQEVEYIESSGTQYIDTGVPAYKEIGIDLDLAFVSGRANNWIPFFGSRSSTVHPSFGMYIRSDNYKLTPNYGGFDPGDNSNVFISKDTKVNIKNILGQFYVNSELKTSISTSVSRLDGTNTIYLFTMHLADGTTQDREQVIKIYSCKIYNGDILLRNFIPCYRKLDNVIGLYDKVEGKFYTNAGTGTFIKGKDVGSGFGDILGYGQIEQKSYKGYQMIKNTSTNSGDNNYWYHFGTFDEATRTLTQTTNEAKEALIGHRLGGLEKNTTYTLSLYAKSNGYVMSMDLFCYNQQVQGVVSKTSIPLTTEFQKITWTFTTTNDVEYGNGTIVRADNNGTTQVGTDAILTIKDVMLEKGSTAHDWEPYVDGQDSPSPSHRQDIEVVRGKNVANLIKGKVPSVNGGQLVDSNYGGYVDYIETYGNDYTISHSVTTSKPYIFFYGDNYTYLGNVQGIDSGYKISSSTYFSNTKYIRLRTDDYTGLKNNLQIEKGSQATSYLPYNTIEATIREKNKAYVNSSTSPNVSDFAKMEQGKTYTFSMKVNGSMSGVNLRYGETAIKTFYGASGNISHTFVAPVTGTLNLNGYGVDNFNGYENIQLEEGSIATTYKPYEEPKTYQLSLGEYEFAKTDIPDKIIYDINNDKVYLDKNTRKVVFNGTETWTMTQTAVGYRFRIDLGGIKASASADAIPKLYCDKLIANSLDNIWNVGGNCIGIFSNLNGVVVICLADLTINTVEKFKTWLTSNNLTAYLPLLETSREEITSTLKDQIKALYNSQSFTGTTIIEIDGQLPLIIKARALKSA